MTSIIDVCSDPAVFKPWFRTPATWRAWFAFLRVLFGLRLNKADLAIYQDCTGRTDRPSGGFQEGWLCVGRRGGKSIVLALIAVFLAAFRDWTPYLSPGERGTIMVIAADRKQARVIFRYILGFLQGVSMLAALIERETADQIDLHNGITIEIQTASFRTARGYSVVAALCDELAFWRSDDSANPDKEIIAAIRPAQATIPGAMLLCVSSPYARRGILWDSFVRHYGKNCDNVLFWKAPTRTMNPSVPQSVIDEAIEADPASAAAEFGAEFRTDVESFVSREVLDACTIPGRYELQPVAGLHYGSGFVDPSGGSADSMTLAIVHRDQWTEKTVLDLVREIRPPFSPESVVAEFCAVLNEYGITSVRGDRYAGEWPRERFRLAGITYLVSEKTKSDIYRDLLPLLNSNQAELLDLPRLHSQLASLERRTARGGNDSIDHPPGKHHDDVANAVAGAIVYSRQRIGSSISAVGVPPPAWQPNAGIESNAGMLQ